MVHRSPSLPSPSPRQGRHPGSTGENESALDPQTLSRLPRPQYGGPPCPPIRPSTCHLSLAVSNSFDRSNGSARSLITYTHSRLGQEYRARRLIHILAFSICHLRFVTCARPCVLLFPQLQTVDNSLAVDTDGLRYDGWRLNVDFLPRANGPMKRAHAHKSPRQLSRQSSDNVLAVPPPIPPP